MPSSRWSTPPRSSARASGRSDPSLVPAPLSVKIPICIFYFIIFCLYFQRDWPAGSADRFSPRTKRCAAFFDRPAPHLSPTAPGVTVFPSFWGHNPPPFRISILQAHPFPAGGVPVHLAGRISTGSDPFRPIFICIIFLKNTICRIQTKKACGIGAILRGRGGKTGVSDFLGVSWI